MKKGDLVRLAEACDMMQGLVGVVLSEERTIPVDNPSSMKFYVVLVSEQILFIPDFWLEAIDEEG